ncbi:MAG: hypothetical protein GY719_26430 [bacterium]|nr:hypothetical protein [bacterium]
MKRVSLAILTALIVCTIAAPLAAENPKVTPAARIGTAPAVDKLMENVTPPRAFGAEKEVLNRVPDSLMRRKPVETTADPLAQRFASSKAPTTGISFGGYDSDDNASQFGFRIMPPDTEGDVGQTYYVQYNNLGWKYFNKSTGALVGGPFPGNIFWQGFGGVCDTDNAGDPIVLYDQFADRWVFSQFTDPGNPDGHQCFAVTQPGAGPGGPYYLYDFVVSPGQFNDYEKITVWTDGAGQSAYHMSSNEFAGSFAGVNATAFDRDAMLAGGAASFVQFSLGTSTAGKQNFALQPSHLEGNATPPAGTCNKYIMAFDNETWGSGPGSDGYRFWTFCVDFNTPSNSTFAETAFANATAFDAELCGYSRDCIDQPGTNQKLDTLGQFTMYRFGTRYFPGTGLRGAISHSVDSGGDVAGVRWASIDVDNETVLDEGTLAPGDGVSRWMPSASIDGSGNIGLVFTKSSNSVSPSVYFTGRETGDPAGTLQAEVVCIDGTGSQLGGNRWGDYASVSVDPVDDCTFWVTNEYVETTGSFQWDTQICSYSFPSCGVSQTCGNNVIEGNEACDGTDLGGQSCGDFGCSGGALACNGSCTGFDTSGCTGCSPCNNNGTCESGEDCNNCPNDCVSGTGSGAVCGNGICESGNGETCQTCSADCNGKTGGKPSTRFCCGSADSLAPNGCGDNRCTSGGFQCTEVPVSGGSFCCGDLTCDSGEDCGNCALDCTIGAEVCTGGIDEDCDAAVDCSDSECSSDPACQTQCADVGESCRDDVDCCSGDCSGGKPSTRVCLP